MKESPILFNGDMVRATLDGRKTQTRRLVEHIPALGDPAGWCPAAREQDPEWERIVGDYRRFCPYGQPGDRLCVRETTRADYDVGDGGIVCAKYAADDSRVLYPGPKEDENGEPSYGGSLAHWWYSRDCCPSIHMPRWASRITLEITDVYVERVRDITAADALAEGIEPPENGTYRDYGVRPEDNEGYNYCRTAVDSYRTLLQSIYGWGPWEMNLWVWVIKFRRVEA